MTTTIRKRKLPILRVDRRRWLRGAGNGVLADDADNMCIIGWELHRRGVPIEAMRNVTMPRHLRGVPASRTAWALRRITLRGKRVSVGRALSSINDAGEPAYFRGFAIRESILRSIFRKIGVRLIFEH